VGWGGGPLVKQFGGKGKQVGLGLGQVLLDLQAV